MSFTALLAAAVVPLGGAQATPLREYPLQEAFGAVVAHGGLFHQSDQGGRGVIRRLDLESGATTTIYVAPNRRTHISDFEVGGGRVAVETVAAGTRLLAMNPDGSHVEQLASGRDSARECGRLVRLLDVSTTGDVLYDDVQVHCRTRRGQHRVRVHSAATGTRTLVSRPTESTFLSMGSPWRTLAGGHLVTWGDRLVRVRNLETGTVRQFIPPDLLTSYAEPFVSSDGRVLLDEFRFMGRGRYPRQTIRLVRGAGRGRVVHRTRREYGQATFCGERPVLFTSTPRGHVRLTALEPRMELFEGELGDPDGEHSCDDGHWAWLLFESDGEDRAIVLPLARGAT